MSHLDDLALMPPELLRRICNAVNMVDILNLQESNPELELVLDNAFFAHLRHLDVQWDANGATFVFSDKSQRTFALSTTDHGWRYALKKSWGIHSMTLACSEMPKDGRTLEALVDAELNQLRKLKISLRATKETSKESQQRCYKKLLWFMDHYADTLEVLRVETADRRYIRYEHKGKESELQYTLEPDFFLHSQFIYPLFDKFLAGLPSCSTSMNMHVDFKERLDFALQSAFQASVPYRCRSSLQALRLEFGTEIKNLSREEVARIFAAFTPYLDTTRNLRRLTCDFTKSQLETAELEKTLKALSMELRPHYAISVVGAGSKSSLDSAESPLQSNRSRRLLWCS